MSNAVFPTVRGLGWSVHKNPQFKTGIQEAASGKEQRVTYRPYPRYAISLLYEYLKNDGVVTGGNPDDDLRTIMGFFMSRGGAFDSFLWLDPYDNTQSTVIATVPATGNGVLTTFQLQRSIGGFTEPVQGLAAAPRIFISDYQGNRECSSTLRTNLLKGSQDFNAAAWVKVNSVTIGATVTAPDGTSTAQTLAAGGLAFGNFHQDFATSDGVTKYQWTMWVQGGTSLTAQIGIFDNTLNNFIPCTFTRTVGNVANNVSVLAYILTFSDTTTWNRITISMNAPVAAGRILSAYYYPAGTGASSNNTKAWGAQAEVWNDVNFVSGSRYIATTTTATASFTDFTVGTGTGKITFAFSPLNAAAITASTISFYHRVRFVEDMLDFENFMYKLWSLRQVDLISLV